MVVPVIVSLFFAIGLWLLARTSGRRTYLQATQAGLAVIELVSLAWVSHAAAGQGPFGVVHLLGDALHLRGGLNWYRNIDRNWELMAPFAGLKIAVPALFIAGDRDIALAFHGMDQVITNLPKNVLKLQKTHILPECGHWTQQERPQEVNVAMIEFLQRL
jgi:pimeloyl-ACP methyl ester carboxylesterase